MKLTKLYSLNEKNDVHDTSCTRKQNKKKDIWSQQSKTCGHNAPTFFNALYDYFSQLEEAKITAL